MVSCGIIGLPNVGKSTLFNALLKRQAALAANYPFATIEPNIGVVPVPDERLVRLAEITKEEKGMNSLPPIKPATVEFVDIAGLVKGASEGAGLGNKFLSHIREVRIIAHVVRAFEDSNVVREGSIDPKSDYETIRTELALADLQTVTNSKGKIQNSKVQVKSQNEIVERLIKKLNVGSSVDSSNFSKEEKEFVQSLNLLSSKHEVIVINVVETDYNSKKIEATLYQWSSLLNQDQDKFVVISAKIEEELAALSIDDQRQYLLDLGLEESGLERLIKKAYQELGLISFLTCGEKEVRAWTIQKGTNAQQAAGEIHTDFIRNFIKAEVVSYQDFISNNGLALSERSESNGWKASRASGKAHLEGRDYIVNDGDVIEFKIGR